MTKKPAFRSLAIEMEKNLQVIPFGNYIIFKDKKFEEFPHNKIPADLSFLPFPLRKKGQLTNDIIDAVTDLKKYYLPFVMETKVLIHTNVVEVHKCSIESFSATVHVYKERSKLVLSAPGNLEFLTHVEFPDLKLHLKPTTGTVCAEHAFLEFDTKPIAELPDIPFFIIKVVTHFGEIVGAVQSEQFRNIKVFIHFSYFLW
jgi:hypothetical protein